MNPKIRNAVNVGLVGGIAYLAVRAMVILPREKALTDQMRAECKLYGVDWKWKDQSLFEILFGYQEVQELQR